MAGLHTPKLLNTVLCFMKKHHWKHFLKNRCSTSITFDLKHMILQLPYQLDPLTFTHKLGSWDEPRIAKDGQPSSLVNHFICMYTRAWLKHQHSCGSDTVLLHLQFNETYHFLFYEYITVHALLISLSHASFACRNKTHFGSH